MTQLHAGGVTVRKGDCALLTDVSMAAHGGEFIGLVGPNGAGKTTLLRALAGLEPATAGALAVDGGALGALSPRERARKIAYLPQTRDVAWAITAEAVASLGRFAYGAPSRLGSADRAAVDSALLATGAEAFRGRTMTTLSGGEQARVHLARAFAAGTPILLVDEPTAALDPRHQRAIMVALGAKAAAGALVIAALHDLRLARRHCTRIIVLDCGRVAADDAAARALTATLLATVFGVGAEEI